MRWSLLFASPLLALPLLACQNPAGPDEPADLGGAEDVAIDEVAIYQGVKRTLWAEGESVESDVPLVAGRDALVRVFVDAVPGDVVGRLIVGGEVIEVQAEVGGRSNDANLDSTVNFDVPGELVQDPLRWSVELLREGEDNDDAILGEQEVEVEGRPNALDVILAPFSYEYDGSGRLPDLSDEQLQRFEDVLYALYPVSEVNISVRDPEPWDAPISPSGDDWFGLGIRLLGYRNTDGASDSTYYYGIFNPAETLGAFCGFGGCLLGVTLLNDSPPETGSVQLRLALGVGFTEEAPLVMAHELGHSHGRAHAPCAPGGAIEGIDPAFPTGDGSIGTWGYDLREGELHDPDLSTDLMGYCESQHVSAYTYGALYARGQNVNADAYGVPGTWDVLSVTEDGAAFATTVQRVLPWAGEEVDVTLLAGDAPTTTRATYLRWDHMPGGLVLVPRRGLPAERAEFTVDGRFLRAQR